MGPKLGLLGPINSLVAYLVKVNVKPLSTPKHVICIVVRLTILLLLIIVSEMSWVLH